MSLTGIAVRALVAYIFLLALLRVSGKRFVSEATGMQFVLAIIVGDLVDDAILATVPFAQLIAAAGTLVVLELVISIAAMSDLRVWTLLEGEPPILLQNGMPRRTAMRRERINPKELASMLRLAGISAARWTEIKRARIEEEGILAVVFHDWAKPPQRNDSEWVKTRMQSRR
jgi:uncharacterized membrane protein YcaP (DUF421 family)